MTPSKFNNFTLVFSFPKSSSLVRTPRYLHRWMEATCTVYWAHWLWNVESDLGEPTPNINVLIAAKLHLYPWDSLSFSYKYFRHKKEICPTLCFNKTLIAILFFSVCCFLLVYKFLSHLTMFKILLSWASRCP